MNVVVSAPTPTAMVMMVAAASPRARASARIALTGPIDEDGRAMAM
jgi:hypothetical protein